MKITAIIAALVLQVGILAYMGVHREYILRIGKIIYLRTAPVDPRDAFRGDYVQLEYDISNVPVEYMRDGLKSKSKNGTRVYAVLDVDENQLGSLKYVTGNKPENEIFICGRIDSRWGWSASAPIKYGIEAYFVEQGKGKKIEDFRSPWRKFQVPLEMEISLGANGIAVLKGYRSGKLGISLELKRDPNNSRTSGMPGLPPRPGRLAGANIKFKNESDCPLAIVDLPGGNSFSLETDLRWHNNSELWKWVNENAPRKQVEDSDVHVLQPGEIYEFNTIDFKNPAWFVKRGNQQVNLGDPDIGWYNFRLVYRPPSKEQCSNLQKADLIWHGYLRSSSFNGGGRID